MLAAVPLFSNQQDVDVKDVVYKARVSLDNVLNVSSRPLALILALSRAYIAQSVERQPGLTL